MNAEQHQVAEYFVVFDKPSIDFDPDFDRKSAHTTNSQFSVLMPVPRN